MVDVDATVFAVREDVSCKTIGLELACESSEKQAAMFLVMANDIDAWPPRQSWPAQCRMIAEALTNEECHLVALTLETLVEHLNAVPAER